MLWVYINMIFDLALIYREDIFRFFMFSSIFKVNNRPA